MPARSEHTSSARGTSVRSPAPFFAFAPRSHRAIVAFNTKAMGLGLREAANRRGRCARLVLKSGVALQARAIDGQTALHAAATAGSFPMALLLLEAEPWLLKQQDANGDSE
jgi:ankyrin repeat protein